MVSSLSLYLRKRYLFPFPTSNISVKENETGICYKMDGYTFLPAAAITDFIGSISISVAIWQTKQRVARPLAHP